MYTNFDKIYKFINVLTAKNVYVNFEKGIRT
jgi:hypothetical protein